MLWIGLKDLRIAAILLSQSAGVTNAQPSRVFTRSGPAARWLDGL